MTLSEAYRQQQSRRPNLDYPYLSIPDIEEKNIGKEKEESKHYGDLLYVMSPEEFGEYASSQISLLNEIM